MLQDATRREQIDHDLLRRYHAHNDLHARDELVRRCMPLVRSLARRYRDRGEAFDDLVQVACLGLVKAIDRFDVDSGHRFISFASPTISGELKRHFRDHTWALHVPRAAQELAADVAAARRELTERHGGVAPTPAAVAAHLDMPLRKVEDALAASNAYSTVSIDRPVTPDGSAIADVHGREDAGYALIEHRGQIEDALARLPERSQRVVRERFFGERLQREIATEVGVSQMQVSRILDGSLREMREHLAAA